MACLGRRLRRRALSLVTLVVLVSIQHTDHSGASFQASALSQQPPNKASYVASTRAASSSPGGILVIRNSAAAGFSPENSNSKSFLPWGVQNLRPTVQARPPSLTSLYSPPPPARVEEAVAKAPDLSTPVTAAMGSEVATATLSNRATPSVAAGPPGSPTAVYLAQTVGMSPLEANAIAERVAACFHRREKQQPRRRPSSNTLPGGRALSSADGEEEEEEEGGRGNDSAQQQQQQQQQQQISSEVEASLSLFLEAGFTSADLAKLMLPCPELALGKPSAERALDLANFLGVSFGLRRYDIRRLARTEPRLFLSNASTVASTASALGQVGLRGKQLTLALYRWPALLLQPASAVRAATDYLMGLGFADKAQVGCMLRVAPWILAGGGSSASSSSDDDDDDEGVVDGDASYSDEGAGAGGGGGYACVARMQAVVAHLEERGVAQSVTKSRDKKRLVGNELLSDDDAYDKAANRALKNPKLRYKYLANAPANMVDIVTVFPQIFDLDVATELSPRLDFLEARMMPPLFAAEEDAAALESEAAAVGGTESAPASTPASAVKRSSTPDSHAAYPLGIGLNRRDVPSVVASFPLVLGLDVETRMRPVVRYLLEEVGLPPEDLSKIFRAFPSLLGLDQATHLDPALNFLRSIGISNVARFVRCLPPVLGYDVETNLRPKWEYLYEELGLGAYDVVRFPAYFSYPLEKVVMPRMRYLADMVNRPGSVWGLNLILTPSDDIFALKVAGTSCEEYAAFKSSFLRQRKRQRDLKEKQEQQRKTEEYKKEKEKRRAAAVSRDQRAAELRGEMRMFPELRTADASVGGDDESGDEDEEAPRRQQNPLLAERGLTGVAAVAAAKVAEGAKAAGEDPKLTDLLEGTAFQPQQATAAKKKGEDKGKDEGGFNLFEDKGGAAW